jgi:hypothetical protein
MLAPRGYGARRGDSISDAVFKADGQYRRDV